MNTNPSASSLSTSVSTERPASVRGGFWMLFVLVVHLGLIILSFSAPVWSATARYERGDYSHRVSTVGVLGIVNGIFLTIAWVLTLTGFFTVAPNTARVLTRFGTYRGTVRESGFYWAPWFTRAAKETLRAQNLNTPTIKVNDLLGNPIEIAATVVWRVADTAKNAFDVENGDKFVDIQSEAALRHVASSHPYDEGQATDVTTTLRGSRDQVAHELQAELQSRLDRAGVEVLEARLSHLAYAQEIASAMLQRQQATAVIAARKLIVEGAVGMVEHALEMLAAKNVLVLDEERKAAMVSNLLVVLCSHSAPTPVLNTGSLYS